MRLPFLLLQASTVLCRLLYPITSQLPFGKNTTNRSKTFLQLEYTSRVKPQNSGILIYKYVTVIVIPLCTVCSILQENGDEATWKPAEGQTIIFSYQRGRSVCVCGVNGVGGLSWLSITTITQYFFHCHTAFYLLLFKSFSFFNYF